MATIRLVVRDGWDAQEAADVLLGVFQAAQHYSDGANPFTINGSTVEVHDVDHDDVADYIPAIGDAIRTLTQLNEDHRQPFTGRVVVLYDLEVPEVLHAS